MGRHGDVEQLRGLAGQGHAVLAENAGVGLAITAMLRTEAGGNPYDKDLTDLIGELSTRSETFRKHWADHNVRQHRTGTKKLHHPVVGDLELNFEAMVLASDPDFTLVIYTATPDTPSADSLRLLATWAATQDQAAPKLHDHQP
ncbi:MmyB family transcriptional regulator [Streptomyces sp. NPDC055681]